MSATKYGNAEYDAITVRQITYTEGTTLLAECWDVRLGNSSRFNAGCMTIRHQMQHLCLDHAKVSTHHAFIVCYSATSS
jgi:hypothetical protein